MHLCLFDLDLVVSEAAAQVCLHHSLHMFEAILPLLPHQEHKSQGSPTAPLAVASIACHSEEPLPKPRISNSFCQELLEVPNRLSLLHHDLEFIFTHLGDNLARESCCFHVVARPSNQAAVRVSKLHKANEAVPRMGGLKIVASTTV